MTTPYSHHPIDQSSDFAMIDMGDADDMGVMNGSGSDYELHNGSEQTSPPSSKRSADWPFGGKDLQDNIKLASSMSSMVQKGRQAWGIYGNIDILRPYFDVEPHEVTMRLLASLLPLRPSAQKQRVARELYGPLMVIFTLIALLLFQMKSSDHKVQEGTLMGTAFGVCFTYWIGASSLVWFLSFVCNCAITYVQILSLMGYALFGHCVVLLITTLVHTTHDHMFFYVAWGVVGGLSALRMVSVISSRTSGKTQRLIICCTVSTLHLLFLLYLHFAYHQIVEEISAAIGDKRVVNVPVIPANPVNTEVSLDISKR